MYLLPLGVLVIFAVGVLVVSIALPRIQERRRAQDTYGLAPEDMIFDPDEPLPGQQTISEDTLFTAFLDDEPAAWSAEPPADTEEPPGAEGSPSRPENRHQTRSS